MKLNNQQKVAAHYGLDADILVLAGAGTGKTSTIIARAVFLIRQGVPSARILLLTFTRRAANEMRHRLKLELGEASAGLFVGTFHKFCLEVIKKLPKTFNTERSTIIDRDDQLLLMRIARGSIIAKGNKEFPKAGVLVNWMSYARNTMRSAEEYLLNYTDIDEEQIGLVVKIFTFYDKRKKEMGYLDFDDILSVFSRTLATKQAFCDQLSSKLGHILVDEMQDTNPVQWSILDGLRSPAKLFCVGDDAQSIYAFRGADFKNVHSFSERVENGVILKLEKNYRSTQEILNLSNWLLSQSTLKYGKKLVAVRGEGIKPSLIDFENKYDEARWIADDLLKRHNDGAKWNEHMVLTRSAYLSRVLEGTLIEKKVPFQFIGGTSLLQAAHVKDLICMMRAADSHRDELAWIRYLKCWPGIGDVTASKVVGNIFACKNSAEAIERAKSILADRFEIAKGLETILSNHDQNPAQSLQYGVEVLDSVLSRKYDRWEKRRKDIDLLIKLASKFKSLKAFIEAYTLDPISNSSGDRSEGEDKATLITIHSAKGTEQKVCYIIQLIPTVFPHVRSIGNEDEEEEERRVLYVAMTRAKDELIMTRCDMLDHGEATKLPYLLSDIPERLIESESHLYESEKGTFLDGLEDVPF